MGMREPASFTIKQGGWRLQDGDVDNDGLVGLDDDGDDDDERLTKASLGHWVD